MSGGAGDGLDDTRPAGEVVDDTVAIDRERPGPRRRAGMPADPVTDTAGGPEATDGSTVIAHRESSRRARGESTARATPAPDVAGRDARLPAAGPADSYTVHPADPVVVPRRQPRARTAQSPVDGSVVEARLRTRARRRLAGVAVAASLVVVASIAAILVLALAV